MPDVTSRTKTSGSVMLSGGARSVEVETNATIRPSAEMAPAVDALLPCGLPAPFARLTSTVSSAAAPASAARQPEAMSTAAATALT